MARENGGRNRPLEALRNARSNYRRIAEILVGEIRRLGDGIDDAKERFSLIQMHQKTLQTLIDFESRIEKQIAERIGLRRGDIDLDRARREILGKLARLTAALRTGGVAGRIESERAESG